MPGRLLNSFSHSSFSYLQKAAYHSYRRGPAAWIPRTPSSGLRVKALSPVPGQNFAVLASGASGSLARVAFAKTTDGTRSDVFRANPDVESRFLKNGYQFKKKYTIHVYERGTRELQV